LGQTLRRYRRFPVFSTPEALFNVAGVQVPVLLIAANSGTEAGFLLLAMQVMTAPMALLGSSISQVYMSRAPEEMREGRLAPFTLSIMRRLVLVGVGPLMVVGALSPFVFPWVFGPNWARAGEIVTWLVPWMALQFIASPVSMVLHTVNRQSWAMALQILGFFLRVLPITWISGGDGSYLVPTFVAGSVAFYFIYILTVIKAAGIGRRMALDAMIGVTPYLLPWIVLSAAIWWLFS
jgi:O-antigen/teichoic acid export membrane protein